MSDLIELKASDTLLERAQKIWLLLGFPNDRLGCAPAIAGYLSAYRELDDRARSASGQKE